MGARELSLSEVRALFPAALGGRNDILAGERKV